MLNDENRYLFKFAFRSILRNRGRSFFIGFSVSLAVFIAVWVLAFFDGMNKQIEKAVVNTNTGFYQLQEKSFSRTTDPGHPLEFTSALREKLSARGIKALSPELYVDANISTPEGNAALVLLGIVPGFHRTFLPVSSGMVEGEFLKSDDENGIVIGQELAAIFKWKTGDQMVVNYQDVTGELRSEILIVRGVYHFSSNSFEKRFAYTTQKTLQKIFLNHYSGKILFHRIPFMMEDLKEQDKLKAALSDDNLVLKTWKDLNPEMSVVIEFNDGMIKFFFIIIALTITMTILTPIQMLWQERFQELRMMNILGVAKKRFWKIGFFEVIQMILFSGVASSILLFIILSIQSRTGVDFRYSEEGLNIERAGIRLTGVVYPYFSPDQIFVTFGFIIFVMCLSYTWAIHRTLKKMEQLT
jgi:ABC-type lipoprotein release transport system permease subunit